MGKGFENYMSKKWFHPTNIDNQKRVYEATQKKAAELKRQQDLKDQYAREQEVFGSKQLMGDEKARLGLAFMYNAPGSLKDQKNDHNSNKEETRLDSSKAEPIRNPERMKNIRCMKCKRFGHANTDRACPLYGKSRLDDDSTELFEEIDRKASLAESTKKPEIKSEPTEYEEARQEVKEEAVEITLDMLRTLSKKEKKAILKRLLRLEKKKSKK